MSYPEIITEALNAAWTVLRGDLGHGVKPEVAALGSRPDAEYQEIHLRLADGRDLYITVSDKEPS